MVLRVGDMREGVHETHRAVEVLEREIALQFRAVGRQAPLRRQLREQPLALGARQRRHAAFAGHASLLGQSAHVRPPSVKETPSDGAARRG